MKHRTSSIPAASAALCLILLFAVFVPYAVAQTGLRVVKNGVIVFEILPSGNAVFSRYASEQLTAQPSADALRCAQSSQEKLWSIQESGGTDIALKGMLQDQAVLPSDGLRFCESGSSKAVLRQNGDLCVQGIAVLDSLDPNRTGPNSHTRYVYAAPGLNYGSISGSPYNYSEYENPSPSFQTRRVDMSAFDKQGSSQFPPISTDATDVPVNGIVFVPSGGGPFPLAIFAHGNHNPLERSEPGYEYLCSFLASHGIISATIDENYFNGWRSGENDARAILILENVRQFLTWNTTSGHPLYQKVDTTNIMIVGHSRGGEAVGHSSFYNQLATLGRNSIRPDIGDSPYPIDGTMGIGPFRFRIPAVLAIAPTDGQYQPVNPDDSTKRLLTVVNDNYFVISGSRDGDVSGFMGYRTYDRAHPVDSSTALGIKGLLWIHGANHNFFNTVWPSNPDCGSCQLLCRFDQQSVLKTFVSGVAQGFLLERSQYLDILSSKDRFAQYLPVSPRFDNGGTCTASWGNLSFSSQFQRADRLFVNHYEEDTVRSTTSPLPPPCTGSNSGSAQLTYAEMDFNLGYGSYLYQQTHGIYFQWQNSTSERYTTTFSTPPSLIGPYERQYTRLSLRGGQSAETPNPVGGVQDFSLYLEDFTGNNSTVAASSVFGATPVLEYPDDGGAVSKVMVMQTVQFPLSTFAINGVNIANLKKLSIVLDRTASDKLYFDEIQFSD